MVEVFKSPINIQRSTDVRSIATSAPIAIEANSSVRAIIPFAKPFVEVPFVVYSITCADNLFELGHYIVEVRLDGFTICIENQSMSARSVKVTYEAKSN
jgi:hypothetical protein